MWQKVAKFKGAEYFRKALYILYSLLLLLTWVLQKNLDNIWHSFGATGFVGYKKDNVVLEWKQMVDTWLGAERV